MKSRHYHPLHDKRLCCFQADTGTAVAGKMFDSLDAPRVWPLAHLLRVGLQSIQLSWERGRNIPEIVWLEARGGISPEPACAGWNFKQKDASRLA